MDNHGVDKQYFWLEKGKCSTRFDFKCDSNYTLMYLADGLELLHGDHVFWRLEKSEIPYLLKFLELLMINKGIEKLP